jgi:hypothetical protein
MLMFIRHAEDPTGPGAPYGVDETGEKDGRSLIVRGWTRAGALVELFDPRGPDGAPMPTRSGIARPTKIFAPDPGNSDSRRSLETVSPLAAALNVQLDSPYTERQATELAATLKGLRGSVLVAWRHEQITTIIAGLGNVDPTPPIWPKSRYDVVYVLTRNGDAWNFTQVPQMLLAGDARTPIR